MNTFIGTIVCHAQTHRRYRLHRITAPFIDVADEAGHVYRYPTINGDPIAQGILVFEDSLLQDRFKTAYLAHCSGMAGQTEDYMYWMRKD